MMIFAGYPDHAMPNVLAPPADGANVRMRAVSAWGGDRYCPNPPPLFALEMSVVDGGKLGYTPSLADVSAAALGTMDELLVAVQELDDVAARVSEGHGRQHLGVSVMVVRCRPYGTVCNARPQAVLLGLYSLCSLTVLPPSLLL